jgi:hypothetical protein
MAQSVDSVSFHNSNVAADAIWRVRVVINGRKVADSLGTKDAIATSRAAEISGCAKFVRWAVWGIDS